jgi:hypothetical protein
LDQNCLLFFIDETGHETFADKNYPVFGLGGCAINSSSAAAVIAEPWRAMKAAHFGGEDVPLHANELRSPTTEHDDDDDEEDDEPDDESPVIREPDE